MTVTQPNMCYLPKPLVKDVNYNHGYHIFLKVSFQNQSYFCLPLPLKPEPYLLVTLSWISSSPCKYVSGFETWAGGTNKSGNKIRLDFCLWFFSNRSIYHFWFPKLMENAHFPPILPFYWFYLHPIFLLFFFFPSNQSW